MLGLLFVVVGAAFIVIGLNGAIGAGATGQGNGEERIRPPVPGAAIRRGQASPRTRRLVGGGWVVLGAIFIVAAFTHQVP